MLCAGALVPPAGASETLRQAVESAWQRSMQRPAASGQIEVARAGRAAAGAVWAAPPALELAHRGDPLSSTVSGQRESELGIAWPLLLAGQRGARSASAEADLTSAEAAERAARLRVAGEVREAAWLVLARQAEASLAEGRAQALEALAADVERRVAAGDLARADALAARAEFLASDAEAKQAVQRAAAARTQWRVLTGTDAIPDALEPLPGAVEEHPEVAAARLATAAAQSRLALTRATRRDPPEVLLRYRNDVAAAGLGAERTLGVALRIPFGTDDRNLPREAAALAELDVARAAERRARDRLEAELATAREAAASAERQLALEESRAALLRERALLVDRSFRAGETPLPELLRTLSAAAQADAGLARQRAELGLARARTRQAAGVLP